MPRSLALEILEKEAALREAGALTPPAAWRSEYLRQCYLLSKEAELSQSPERQESQSEEL